MGREFKRGLRLLRVYALGVGYLSVVYLVMVAVALSPAYALQASSTQYSRVVQQAELILAKAAARASIADAVAAAAIVPTPAGVAVKALALGLTVGVPLGLALWETYFTAPQLSTIKQNGATPAQWAQASSGHTLPSSQVVTPSSVGGAVHVTAFDSCRGFSVGFDLQQNGVDQYAIYQDTPAAGSPPAGAGWLTIAGGAFFNSNGTCPFTEWTAYGHFQNNPTTLYAYQPASAGTQASISAYLQGLSASDPNSIDTHTANQGVGVAAPAHDAGTQTQAVTINIDNSTHVVPADQVPAGAVIVNVNVPPPINTVTNNNTTNNNTSTVTTTTTTTNNPNGSVTTVATSSDTQASVSPCVALGHQPDTLGSILAKHQATWKTSGLLSTLTALKALVFTGSPPVISLPTHLFGTFTVDFGSSTWAFVFTVMQSIFLALAGLVSVRIVFGRG